MLALYLEKLKNRLNLNSEECGQAVRLLLGAHPVQAAAFLVLLHAKTESIDELFAMLEFLHEQMVVIPLNEPVLDIVGTGGDGASTINISTAASILSASCGVKVAKHGNRAVSSQCGSADVLTALGVEINQSAQQVQESIEQIGIGFCYAPNFHPALQSLKTIRQVLEIPTTFNLVAPLCNPARASYYVLGVYKESYLMLFAELLFRMKVKHALVVHSQGLDELSLLGPAQMIEVTAAGVERLYFDPRDYGFQYCSLSDLQGADAKFNAKRLSAIFSGESGALADTIILNAGVALYAANKVESIGEGLDLARQQLFNGTAMHLLNQWIQFTKREEYA